MYDYLIIGGGIVGLSTAWQLQQREPGSSILLVEKEDRVAAHQTGRNSGVLHAGIYYTPGSLKARFCKSGVEATVRYCEQHNLPFEQCGKLIVATDKTEHERLLVLFGRAQENGLDVELLDADALRRREPNVVGTGAIFLKTSGITDYPAICRSLADQFKRLGGTIRLGCAVVDLHENDTHVKATLASREIVKAHFIIACGGLMADRLAKMMYLKTNFQIIPFRGEYYRLAEKNSEIVEHLIYPVPKPDLPFLGVHLTRTIDGAVIVGPNAVQGWMREGYGRINVNLTDTLDMLLFSGFWKMLRQNWKTGLLEFWNSINKRAYLKRVQVYCPSIELADLQPYPAGVRAMAVTRNGELVHDFLFAESPRSLHVCSAPSPAATSAIPIGEYICDKILKDRSATID